MSKFISQSSQRDIISLDNIVNIWKDRHRNQIMVSYLNATGTKCLPYSNNEILQDDFERLIKAISHQDDRKGKLSWPQEKILKVSKSERDRNMLDTVKKYYKDHEDILFPLLIVVVLDHFFNNGGLRERLVALAQGLLDGIQNKLTSQIPPKEE